MSEKLTENTLNNKGKSGQEPQVENNAPELVNFKDLAVNEPIRAAKTSVSSTTPAKKEAGLQGNKDAASLSDGKSQPLLDEKKEANSVSNGEEISASEQK